MGDFVPGGLLAYSKSEVQSTKLKNYLMCYDLRIATLESPIGNSNQVIKEKSNIVYSPKETISRLKELDINIVSLANNHTFDLSVEGFNSTIKLLRENHILYLGAGMDLTEAREPIIISHYGKKLGFLAYCSMSKYLGKVYEAKLNKPGVSPLKTDYVIEDIEKLRRQGCDYIFLILHWGIEYTWLVSPEDKKMARDFLDKGATGIFGSHSHRVQPYSSNKDNIICYSLGNFLFTDFIMCPPQTMLYPDVSSISDVATLPKTYNYIEISQPTIRVWKFLSRIGMLCGVIIHERRVMFKTSFVYLHKNRLNLSHLNISLQILIKIWLKFIAVITSLPGYNFLFKVILRY